MDDQLLAKPVDGTCRQCGIHGPNRRNFISNYKQTTFCESCWAEFLDECTVNDTFLKNKIGEKWSSNTQINLVVKIDHGTAQKIKWN
jgi:hypothetical protein